MMADEEDKHVMIFVDLFRKPEHPTMYPVNVCTLYKMLIETLTVAHLR
jgi:hypothetical protein